MPHPTNSNTFPSSAHFDVETYKKRLFSISVETILSPFMLNGEDVSEIDLVATYRREIAKATNTKELRETISLFRHLTIDSLLVLEQAPEDLTYNKIQDMLSQGDLTYSSVAAPVALVYGATLGVYYGIPVYVGAAQWLLSLGISQLNKHLR